MLDALSPVSVTQEQPPSKGSIAVPAGCRWPSENARRWFADQAPLLVDNPQIVSVVLIGSVARNVAHERSDIDFYILYRGTKPSLKDRPIDVDILWQDADALDGDVKAGKELAIWAVKYGVVLWDRGDFWRRFVSKWYAHLPIPAAAPSFQRSQDAAKIAEELLEDGDEEAALEQATLALSHRARALLYSAQLFPASRPELPGQLELLGHAVLAGALRDALYAQASAQELLTILRTQG